MGSRFLLVLLTLYALLSLLQPFADGSLTNSDPDPPKYYRSRTLLRNPEPEKSTTDPPAAKELPSPFVEESESDSEHHEKESTAEAPSEGRKLEMHHPSNKSVGGGCVIAGFVAAIFVSVYCYIRVTRRRDPENLTKISHINT